MQWRWDQGRLEYFQYDEIKKISKALHDFDGKSLPGGNDLEILRITLSLFSDMPFSPAGYTVWRNYGRVFGCQLLAAKVKGILVCTELCKKIALGNVDVDDYLLYFAKTFYYPSPSFEGYSPTGKQVFPAIAIIKYLLAKYAAGLPVFISLEQVIDLLIGNDVSGLEPLKHYLTLKPTGYKLPNDPRQIRELIVFLSQFSFLKWADKKLFLDVAGIEEALEIEKQISPTIRPRNTDAALEILSLGANYSETGFGEITSKAAVNVMDMEFTEGSKIKVTHLRSERSGKLKELFFHHHGAPHICNMCSMNTVERYPWVDRIIELHHLLPLSSPIRFESEKTTLKDMVGLCPSCHRATHKFYSKWLKSEKIKDFRSYHEAHAVYDKAKCAIALP